MPKGDITGLSLCSLISLSIRGSAGQSDWEWLVVASPIFIQIGLEAASRRGFEQEGMVMCNMPSQGRLLDVIRTACIGLPWLCKVGSPAGEGFIFSSWLQENPKERQQVVDAITSPRMRSVLWATLAAHVRCLLEDSGGRAMAFSCKVPSCDYRAAFDGSDDRQTHWLTGPYDVAADDIRSDLLLVLSTSYLLPHAEEVWRLHQQSKESLKSRAAGSATASSSSSTGGLATANSSSSSSTDGSATVSSSSSTGGCGLESRSCCSSMDETRTSTGKQGREISIGSSSTLGSCSSQKMPLGRMGLDEDDKQPMVNWLFCTAAAVGGAGNAGDNGSSIAAQSNAASSRSAGGSSMVATQLLLVLDTLLLTWPAANSNRAVSTSVTRGSSSQPLGVSSSTSSSTSTRGSSSSSRVPSEEQDWSHQSWLLLFIGLLQQADSEAKQQLMEKRGGLLLQLLYHAVVTTPFTTSSGEVVYPDGWLASRGGVAAVCTEDVEFILRSQPGAKENSAFDDMRELGIVPVCMSYLVERLLQALFYKALPAGQQLMDYSNFAQPFTLLNESGG